MQASAIQTSATKPMTVFWIVKTSPQWLAKPALGADGRFDFAERVFKPILRKHPGVQLRFFDIEAYSAFCSNLLMWTVTDVANYNALVEDLRETAFWDAYFQVLHILPSFEDQYADHYAQARLQDLTEA
jgi:Darcynin, domain of unknown function